MTDNKPEIHLKYWREQKGYTQQSLADKLGVTRQTVTNIETGRQYLSFKLLKEIADVLGITIGVLIDGPLENERKRNESLSLLVMDMFERMPEHLMYQWLSYGSRILGDIHDEEEQ